MSMMDQLRTADPAELPRLVHGLSGLDDNAFIPSFAKPRLLEMIRTAAPNSRERLNASLVLLPMDESQVDYLYEQILESQPFDMWWIIREALSRHKDKVSERLWTVLESPREGADRRFRAACALANYESGDPRRWAASSKIISDRLLARVAQDPAQYAFLVDNLRPIRDSLRQPLAAAKTDESKSLTERAFAGSIMADYATEKPK
jgi:hypothetical protein